MEYDLNIHSSVLVPQAPLHDPRCDSNINCISAGGSLGVGYHAVAVHVGGGGEPAAYAGVPVLLVPQDDAGITFTVVTVLDCYGSGGV